MRKNVSVAIIVFCVVLVSVSAFAYGGGQEVLSVFKYVGRAVEVKFETGNHFRVEYVTENSLRWTSLKDRDDGVPMTGEETYYLNQQTDDIFTLSWIEDTGISVTHNLDFKKMEVYAFMSWNEPSARGGRAILDHRGTIAFME